MQGRGAVLCSRLVFPYCAALRSCCYLPLIAAFIVCMHVAIDRTRWFFARSPWTRPDPILASLSWGRIGQQSHKSERMGTSITRICLGFHGIMCPSRKVFHHFRVLAVCVHQQNARFSQSHNKLGGPLRRRALLHPAFPASNVVTQEWASGSILT